MTRRTFHRALAAAGMDTCPFWETVMMCSLADMTPLYVKQAPLYGWGARPIARPHQSVVCLVDACEQLARQLEATRGHPSQEHHLESVSSTVGPNAGQIGTAIGGTRRHDTYANVLVG